MIKSKSDDYSDRKKERERERERERNQVDLELNAFCLLLCFVGLIQLK
jgi:hypothetical protein